MLSLCRRETFSLWVYLSLFLLHQFELFDLYRHSQFIEEKQVSNNHTTGYLHSSHLVILLVHILYVNRLVSIKVVFLLVTWYVWYLVLAYSLPWTEFYRSPIGSPFWFQLWFQVADHVKQIASKYFEVWCSLKSTCFELWSYWTGSGWAGGSVEPDAELEVRLSQMLSWRS